ncbi:terminase small subunit [Anaerostipes hadrus]|uniref:terminase small subunit n=1 Tax=Anaerostipes hadrus TaxID=649756 RepID=UPI00096151A6|nr:terminase small subunit [Anaerostipes hadrus]NSJ72855.1 phage portal protein [Anaerostipes hadrus]OKZ65312.1 MAG: phage portal protein [Clostridiales bacterium 41_12_two_minus]
MNEEKNYILAESDYVAGMKYKDIAAKYGVSINTVKSWKKRYAWSRNKKTGCIQKGCTQNKKGAHKKEAVAEDVSQVVINDELTDQQQLFCLYQSRMFNYTKAYMKAYPGCTYASAAVLGSRLMKNQLIRKTIEQLKQNHMNREMLKQEDIFQKYMDIAFADMNDFMSFGQEEIETDYGPRMVNSVRLKESDQVDGTLITEVKQGRDGVSVKLADRMKAIDWLADHMDIATAEQKAKIEQIRAKTAIMSGTSEEETEDDGFIEALKGEVADVWEEE